MAKPKVSKGDTASAQNPPPPAPARIPPLFRKIDWLTLAITFAVVWITYLLTLAPELTLEDSGELVTGSYYAGIPHPPGYPVWTIYSWLWTVLLPVGNIAWRVAVGQATSGALACGLLALMVSRGSSMLMEGIEELKAITGKWENAICIVSGLVAGLLVGLDSFMWSESVVVNRIAVFSVPWFLMVLICLLRWIYAPHQLRYAYWALFLYGMCITTHQSLLAASIGIEVTIAAGNKRLGRDVFLGNGVIYLIYNLIVLATGQHIFQNIGSKPGLLFLFHAIGVGSLIVSGWLAVKTKGILSEWKPVLIMGLLWMLGVSFYFYMPIAGMTNPPMQWGYPRTVEGFFHALSRGQYAQPSPTNILAEPHRFLGQLEMLIGGAAEEFSWVYLLIALVPFAFFRQMQKRERTWIIGLTAIYFCVGVLLIILLNPTPDRSSSDLIKVFLTSSHTIVAALIGYGLALIAAFMATNYRKFRCWGLLGGIIAAALALYRLWDATGTHYFGKAGRVDPSELLHWISQAFAKNQYGLPVFANLIVVVLAFFFILALVVYRNRAPLLVTLGLFAAMPLYSALGHWFDSEQRNHMFGYWFGHDMFTPPFRESDGKPFYPSMAKDAVLFGGTDPGRFCPTYMIFCESFTPHDSQPAEDRTFDRRDVYIITQNALADDTYLEYIRAQYNKSRQIPYDTPFFSGLAQTIFKDKPYQTNLLARMVSPLDRLFTAIGDRVEERRRTSTSLFNASDFVNLPAFVARLRTGSNQDPVSQWLYTNLNKETRDLVTGSGNESGLRKALAEDLNRLLKRELTIKKQLAAKQQEQEILNKKIASGSASQGLRDKREALGKEIANLSSIGSLYEPARFQHVALSEYLKGFIKENPQGHTRIRLNRLLLEAAYPNELAKSLGGVYPDREIYIPTPEDLQGCFQEYYLDAGRRFEHDRQFPNEPKQVRAGEGMEVVGDRIQISGQFGVMAVNNLITKIIFDRNPGNEFYVEESMPLDWMFPYLTPYGIIMKLNRSPLPELADDIIRKDHAFWKQYSKRLTGDIIDQDTPLTEIVRWIETTYLRHDFNGFAGDRKFVRDDDAQKAFSKLRGSIGGLYAWRAGLLYGTPTPPQYLPKTLVEQQRMIRAAEFAFKQAFAFCPYNLEAASRYINMLTTLGRWDDALIIAQTCLKLDPYNSQVQGLVANLQAFKQRHGAVEQTRTDLARMEDELRKNPTNVQIAFNLAGAYFQMQQTNRAMRILDSVLNEPRVEPDTVFGVVQIYAKIGDWPRLEIGLEKLVKIMPDNPDVWFNLAAFKSTVGKSAEALKALSTALDLSAKRLQVDSKAQDLLLEARKDTRFNALRQMPEFQKLMGTQ